MHTLRAAAKAVGRDRTTLTRAIRSGKLSASRDEVTGAWLIEPAELHRLYPPADVPGAAGGDAQARTPDERDIMIRELQVRLGAAQELARVQEHTLADVRRRLDTATAQLGEALTQVRLLTDQRPAQRSWWRLLLSGK